MKHDDDPVTWGDCKESRKDCGTDRNRMRTAAFWAIGIAVTVLLALSGYITSANEEQWKAITGLKEKTAGQQTELDDIKNNTDEMRSDIKKLLERR